MNPILEYGIKLNFVLQAMGDGLAGPMNYVSMLGHELFFLLFVTVLYWCISATMGLHLGVLLMLDIASYGISKMIFHAPRPYWVEPSLKAFAEETSFGIPSGHSQNTVLIWGFLAYWIHKTWAWVVAVIIILLVGLSRMYLGVHFPTDVLAGWALGALVLWAYIAWNKRFSAWLGGLRPGSQVLFVSLVSFGLILAGWLVSWIFSGWEIPSAWYLTAAAALPVPSEINPFSLAGVVSASAALFGLGMGAILIRQRGGFDAGGVWWVRILRYLVGLVGVAVFYVGLDLVFPGGDDLLGLSLRFVRYALVGLWVVGLAPMIFIWLKLARPNPSR